jgi:molybdenum-dependent DNA-binding transcriptional regulator ModE
VWQTARDNRLSIKRTTDCHLIIGDAVDGMASLTAFIRVVESGGFTAAARRLNLSPTMVSNHVQALEDSLGAPVDRGRCGN